MTDKKNDSDATESEIVEVTDAESAAVEPDAGTEMTQEADVEESEAAPVEAPKKKSTGARVLAYGVLPALALVLALGAGFLKWQDSSVRGGDAARTETVQVAKDATVALLSYQPDTVEQQLTDARSLLTGQFQESYTELTTDVVIPGAKEKKISAVATVPAAASVSVDSDQAVVLVFVNQTVVVGSDAPTDTASSVRVTLDKVGDRWLISGFDPV